MQDHSASPQKNLPDRPKNYLVLNQRILKIVLENGLRLYACVKHRIVRSLVEQRMKLEGSQLAWWRFAVLSSKPEHDTRQGTRLKVFSQCFVKQMLPLKVYLQVSSAWQRVGRSSQLKSPRALCQRPLGALQRICLLRFPSSSYSATSCFAQCFPSVLALSFSASFKNFLDMCVSPRSHLSACALYG